MASAFTHAIAAAALGSALVPRHPRLIAFGALCAAAPDLDVIGFGLGVRYNDLLGHRGLSHSLAFALLAALAFTPLRGSLTRPTLDQHQTGARLEQRIELSRLRVAAYLFLAIASHGALDALTNGGLGVAFFAPFSAQRYFFPWRPIQVSPISIGRFFSGRGIDILLSEFSIVWVPALALVVLAALLRRALRRIADV